MSFTSRASTIIAPKAGDPVAWVYDQMSSAKGYAKSVLLSNVTAKCDIKQVSMMTLREFVAQDSLGKNPGQTMALLKTAKLVNLLEDQTEHTVMHLNIIETFSWFGGTREIVVAGQVFLHARARLHLERRETVSNAPAAVYTWKLRSFRAQGLLVCIDEVVEGRTASIYRKVTENTARARHKDAVDRYAGWLGETE
ncbi:hypothetical protein PYCC9005_001470 [Savitreella phatthalungensis]